MGYGKKNEVKVDILSYNIGLLGESGIGKTTIIKQMLEKLAGEDGYIFAECGHEDGADAIEGINYINCPDFDSDYNEYSNSIGFDNFIEDIILHKTTDYPNLRTVVIDTYDQLVEIYKKEVVEMHNRENPDKKVKSIKGAFGGYMAGEDKANELVLDRLWDLKKVGVHFIIIGHVKTKTNTDIVTGEEYNVLTTNMSGRDFNAIKTKLHFLGLASIDRQIVRKKTNKKDNNGKIITKGVVTGESRKITFRDDNYSMDSKSRFADIVSEIPFDVDELIKALEDAIKAEQSKSGKSYEVAKAEQNKAKEEYLNTVAKAEEANNNMISCKEVVGKICAFMKENRTNAPKINSIMKKCSDLGYSNPTEIENIDEANAILELCTN